MSLFWWIVIITAIAGVGGTGIGGIVGILLTRDSSKMVSLLLAFAGGIMLAVVCFDLIPESFRPEGAFGKMPLWLVLSGIIIGYVVVALLNLWIDKRTNSEVEHINNDHPHTADALEELIHSDHLDMHRTIEQQTGNRTGLFAAGIVMACAIALHNMPEGMVIGASYAGNHGDSIAGSIGFVIAIVIGLHNIPEGMAVSVPLVSGGMSKKKAAIVTALSGAPTIIGAMIGYLLGLLSPTWLCLSLSFASGAMAYVVLGELFPEAFLMWKSKAPGAAAMVGILLGIVLVQI